MALALKDLALCEYCCEVYMKIVLKSNLSFSIKRIDHYLNGTKNIVLLSNTRTEA